MIGIAKAPATRAGVRWGVVLSLTATAAILVFLVLEVPLILADYRAHPGSFGGDFQLYLDRTRELLSGGSFYLDRQLHGPYQWAVGDALYPPSAVYLFAPFLVLPGFLWFAVPPLVIGWVVWHHRPKPWAWPLIALCVAWPFTINTVLYGNPTPWIAMFCALGTVYGWPAVLVLLKPSLGPFALVGVRRRSWWIALAIGVALSLPLMPLWIQYLAVVRDGNLPLSYSIHDVPILLVGPVAKLANGSS